MSRFRFCLLLLLLFVGLAGHSPTVQAAVTCSACYGSGDCNECDGSKKCQLCHGSGVVGVNASMCELCGGGKGCHVCDASGDCFPCSGSGNMSY
jgi:hypothetical protein